MKNKEKVVMGMSGGVDSSVGAYLLQQNNYDVIGLFMYNWEEKDGAGHCSAEQDWADVRRVCTTLNIPYYNVNFSKQYYERVFEEFLHDYQLGLTPNPDVLCNREIKFGPFLDYALQLGADKIATGHYCKVERIDEKYVLKKADDLSKDQTYFLNQLNQFQLSKVIFPVGNMKKTDLRKLATKLNLITAEKKDSTGICFIGERNFKKFLFSYLPAKPGNICTLDGKVVGHHDGVLYYTLGQRRGLGIGGQKDSNGNRWFVAQKDVKNNILYVCQGNMDILYTDYLTTFDFNWISGVAPTEPFKCNAKFRYRQPDQGVTVTPLTNGSIKIDFDEPQRAITPGQYAVLYDKDICLGGGKIAFTAKNEKR